MPVSVSPLIAVEHVSVRRNGRQILDDVSLTLREHDFITLVGPNGAGKTMLIKAMLGLYKPDTGHIYRHADLRIGYVPEHSASHASLPITVADFLRLRNKYSDVDIEATCALTNITALAGQMLHTLSGGEWQRVLLTRALIRRPNVLILDEPTQNLDMGGQLRFYQLIDQIYHAHKLTILLVSHDLHLVMASTQKVVCLFHHICCAGTPQTVTRDPQFLRLFGNEVAHMLSVYPHVHDHDHDIGKT